jgi:hypothetical protein
MTYYCFLCNENHEGVPTEEHFIPRSIDGPEHQHLPVCLSSNNKSNTIFDNHARDLLYWVRFKNTSALKRLGEALLSDGTLKPFKFSYHEDSEQVKESAFHYIFDRETNTNIPTEKVYAIAVRVGLMPDEQNTYCKGLAKMSLGALAYLLKNDGNDDKTIRKIFSQPSFISVRHFALSLPWSGKAVALRFSLGRSDVLERLHGLCKNQQIRNHMIKIFLNKDTHIKVTGMLYSQYGWELDVMNSYPIEKQEFTIENPIINMKAPESFKDLTLSPDRVCIINPEFMGPQPEIPAHWRNT